MNLLCVWVRNDNHLELYPKAFHSILSNRHNYLMPLMFPFHLVHDMRLDVDLSFVVDFPANHMAHNDIKMIAIQEEIYNSKENKF